MLEREQEKENTGLLRRQVDSFKNDLKHYEYFKDTIRMLKDRKEECYRLLSHVGAVDPSREPVHSPPNKDLEYKLRDDIELYDSRIKILELKVTYVSMTLNKMPKEEQYMVIDKFINGLTERQVANKYGYSSSGVHKKIDNTIKRALK